MLDAGLSRLRALQHADGGFGWWESDASDPHMTAYVLHGLTRVAEGSADPAPAKAIADRAAAWLRGWLEKPGTASSATHAFAVMALADARAPIPAQAVGAAADDGVAVTPPLERAFLLRAAVAMGRAADAKVHLRNLLGHAERDADGVRFGGRAAGNAPGPVARWADDPVETTAWALGAVLLADPRSDVLVPGARWLLSRRVDGARWRSTRDSAACVGFLTRLAVATGEAGAGRRVEVSLNGARLGSVTVTAESAFSDAATLVVPDADLPRGVPLEVRATTEGGAAAVSASLSFTETGPAIEEASSGLVVRRTWNLLVPRTRPDGTVAHVPAAFSESVPTGTLLEAEVAVESREPREFVMVTSPHPAGFEPERRYVAAERPADAPEAAADHRETRDDRTVFFAKALPAGRSVFRHVMRATHVGAFTALPAQAELMYFPDVRGNSRGGVLEVSRAAEPGLAPGGEGGK
jgi:uncharacterized protein YfaS (alpha-2-macroglobulin family)